MKDIDTMEEFEVRRYCRELVKENDELSNDIIILCKIKDVYNQILTEIEIGLKYTIKLKNGKGVNAYSNERRRKEIVPLEKQFYFEDLLEENK